jgi:beta-lactamase regulating signal transducer with metallopeptidase domain
MYALRGVAVSFSVFFILYGVISIAASIFWHNVWSYGRKHSAGYCSNLLFVFRITPFIVALVATLSFAVPSFLLFEPRATEESVGAPVVALACCGIVTLLFGIWNAVNALLQASRTTARWSKDTFGTCSPAIHSVAPITIIRVSAAAPPLAASGILWPRVWLSRAAESVLSERELHSALRHEVFHVQRRDNLRKLLFRLAAFPGMTALESAWREISEMAADDAAVSNASEALDLAAALIKLSRLSPLQPAAELTTALVQRPAESVNARIERLLAWNGQPQSAANEYPQKYCLGIAAATLTVITVTYFQLLVRIHTATEWLVR